MDGIHLPRCLRPLPLPKQESSFSLLPPCGGSGGGRFTRTLSSLAQETPKSSTHFYKEDERLWSSPLNLRVCAVTPSRSHLLKTQRPRNLFLPLVFNQSAVPLPTKTFIHSILSAVFRLQTVTVKNTEICTQEVKKDTFWCLRLKPCCEPQWS